MTVALDTVAEFAQFTTSPVSIEFTPVGTARGIIVGITQTSSNTDTVTGVTVEGVAMTRVDTAQVFTAGRSWLYFLGTSIAAGTVTVEITTTGSSTKWAAVASVTAAGDTEIGDFDIIQAAVANPQIALDTGAVSSLRMSIIHSFQGSPAALVEVAGMETSVAAAEHDYGSTSSKLGRQTTAASGSATIGYTIASTTELMVAAAIQESTGPQPLTGSLFTSTPVFFGGGTVVLDGTLTGVLFVNTPSFFAGTVTTGAAALTGSLFTSTSVFFGGVVTAAAVVVPGPDLIDEGLRLEAWTLPNVGPFTRKFDLTKWAGYNIADKFGSISDGRLDLPVDFPKLAELFTVDKADHSNDVGSVIRVLTGTTPILHYVLKGLDDRWSSEQQTLTGMLEGMDFYLDRALVPNFDYPAAPTVEPDWHYGLPTVLQNAGFEDEGASNLLLHVWLESTVTAGTWQMMFDAETTAAMAWNIDLTGVQTAIEALPNITDIVISGAGTETTPWIIEVIVPAGTDFNVSHSGTVGLTGGSVLMLSQHQGGAGLTDPWTRSFNPLTGLFHGTYINFQPSTTQAHSGTWSLYVKGALGDWPDSFPGAQQIVSVTGGRAYRASVWVYPIFSRRYRFVLRTTDETWVASVEADLTAGSWQEMSFSVTMPVYVRSVIFRIACISNTDGHEFYVDDGLHAPGMPAATYGKIMGDLLTAIQALGILTWVTKTWTDTHDSSGAVWDQNRVWSVKHRQSLLQLVEWADRWNYESDGIHWDTADGRFEWGLYNPTGAGANLLNSGLAVVGKVVTETGSIVNRIPDASHYYAEGDQGYWGEFEDPVLAGAWGTLQKSFFNTQGFDTAGQLELATRLVADAADRTAGLVTRLQAAPVKPWVDFKPGDRNVMVNLAPVRAREYLRCMAIVAKKDREDNAPTYEAHWGSVVYQGEAAVLETVRRLVRKFEADRPATAVFDGRPVAAGSIAAGGSAPTLVIAAVNSSDSTKARADIVCTGTGDNFMFQDAVNQIVAGGGGRLLVTEGDYTFTGTVTIYGAIRIEGMGIDATRIAMAAGANVDMFHLPSVPALIGATFEVEAVTLDGSKASQTSGIPSGIRCDPQTAAHVILHGVDIRNFRGYGLNLNRPASRVQITSSMVTLNEGGGIFLFREGDYFIATTEVLSNGGYGIKGDGAKLKLVGCKVQSNTLSGFSSGGIFQQPGQTLVGNDISNNGAYGIDLDSEASVIAGNYLTGNLNGMIVYGNEPVAVTGNNIHQNINRGAILSGGAGNLGGVFSGNAVYLNGQHGIYIDGSHWLVQGNRIDENGVTTNNTYDGIHLVGSHCSLFSNLIRQDPAANKQRYAINVAAGDCNNVAGNDLGSPSSYGTGALNNAGTDTRKTWPADSFYGDNYTGCDEEPGVPDEVVGGPDDTTAPDIPIGLTAQPGDTEIFLDWTDNEELDLASYKIYRSTSSGGTYTLLMTVVDLSEHVDTGLTNGTPLWYKISAVDETGNESALSTAVSTTPAVPPAATPPPVPTGLTAVAGDGHVDLAWTPVFASDFSHYNVYQATATGGPYTLYGTRTVPNAVVGGLTNTTPYFFVVTSEDITADESADSNEATATPIAVSPPGGLPAIDVTFDSGNLYTAAKVNAEAAGTVFLFTITGGNSSGPRYESATIPTKAGNEYVFDQGAILDGNGSTVLAFARGVADVKIYDCEFTAYQGQNASGTNNTKGAAAIRLDDGWELIRPNGHHNKYSAVSFDGNDAHVLDGRLHYNGEFGFKGGGGPSQSFTGCWIDGTEVDHNGGAQGLDLQGDQGGCKVVHSIGFQFLNVNAHDNYGSGGAASIGTQGGNGLWADINNIGTVYDGCTLTNNRGAGIFHEVSLSFEIKNCTFTNNGRDYAAANPGSAWPVSSQIQISNSGGTLGWIHDNTIVVNGTVSGLGFHGITVFNSQHFQWTHGVISNGCLGTRNLLIENNTITMSGAFWKSAIAITGTLPTSRSGDQYCGQVEITAVGSNNRIRTNTESLSGGAFPSTPYFRSGTRVTAAQWAGFGYS